MMLLTTIHSYHLLRTYHGSFIILEALPKLSHLNLRQSYKNSSYCPLFIYEGPKVLKVLIILFQVKEFDRGKIQSGSC